MANQSQSRDTKPQRWRDFVCCVSGPDAKGEGSRIPPSNQLPTSLPRNPNIASSSTSTAPFAAERFGMFIFQDQPERADSSIDIVAIHGLGGHYEDTWTWIPTKPQGGTPCNWLKDLLPTQIPNARIMSFGYNSAVARSKSIGDIKIFGEQLLGRVLHERRSEQQKCRPIIFVCHSLGGIVLKKALMLANERRNKRSACSELLDSVKGIVFMGTPHRGSATASLGSMGAEMLRAAALGTSTNTTLIKQLKEGSKVLQDISNAFTFLGADFPIHTFYETEIMDWLTEVIVTEESARLNVPNEDVFPLDGNHSNMCKFPGDTQNYRFAVGVIKDMAGASRQDEFNFLSALDRLGAHFPRYPIHQAGVAERLISQDSQDFAWFFESPEFLSWTCHESDFLWLSGIPNSGKTVLSFCLWDHLKRTRTYNQREDIAIYSCSTTANMNQTAESQIAQILSTLIIQLLRSDKERLELVVQQCRLFQQPGQLTTLSPSPALLDDLWKVLFTSVVTPHSRQVIILIDAVDALRTVTARKSFLRNLLQLRTEVLSKGVPGFKIFVTSKPFDDIKKELSEVSNIEKDKERQECLRTLKFNELNARRDRVEKAHSGTGKWLADDVAYANWDSSNTSSLLLISGKPGSGKSTLAKSILDSKRSQRTGSDVLIVDFFYSFRGGKKETSHTLMLQSILYQLLSRDERLFPLFRDVYRARRMEPDFKWQDDDLRKIFASLPSLKTGQKIYILLDAMDESTEQGRSEILRLLLRICSSESNCIFKCLIASRPLPAGEINQGASHCSHIILQEKNREDIENVITSGLRDIGDQTEDFALDFQFARDYMTQHAQGVFLWVTLVLEELKKLAAAGTSQEELDHRLKDLPLDLEEMYSLIIQRLVNQPKPPFPDMAGKGAKMLTWVTFAERPLRLEELCDALAIPSMPTPRTFNLEPGSLDRNRVRGLDLRMRACCGPLLEIRQSVVQLLHATLREYLLRKDRPAKPFDTDEETGGTEIASGCIRYLRHLSLWSSAGEVGVWSMSDYEGFVKWLAGHPLLEYVVSFLPRHLKILETLASDSPVFSELSLFLEAMQKDHAISGLFESWAKLLNRPGTSDWQPGLEPGQFKIKCLIAAARNGYGKVVESLMKLHTNVSGLDEESGDFALLAAVDAGHYHIVKFLLERGADPNSEDKAGETALLRAIEKGHEDVVEVLLMEGANPNSTDKSGRTALLRATEKGHETFVESLLLWGADANSRDNSGHTSLFPAAENGHAADARLLLQTGAGPEANKDGDGDGQTALSRATEKQIDAIFQLLQPRK